MKNFELRDFWIRQNVWWAKRLKQIIVYYENIQTTSPLLIKLIAEQIEWCKTELTALEIYPRKKQQTLIPETSWEEIEKLLSH